MQALPESFAKRSQLLGKRNQCKQTWHVSEKPAVLRREFQRSRGRHCRFRLRRSAAPHAELTRTGQCAHPASVWRSVRFRDRLVFPQLFYQNIRFSSIATAEDCPCGFVKEADRVLFLSCSSEIGTILVVDQSENAGANGNARSARVTGVLQLKMFQPPL